MSHCFGEKNKLNPVAFFSKKLSSAEINKKKIVICELPPFKIVLEK